MSEKLYPLSLTSFYKNVIWGGRKLAEKFNRSLPEGPVGEAWEICDRTEFCSLVTNGPLKGCSLHQLIEKYGSDFLGTDVHTNRFPLLVKLLDARDRLSLQVHPDERASAVLGGTAEPKTEMWYVIDTEDNAKIIAGLDKSASPENFWTDVNSPEIEKQLHVFSSKPGDVFFIKAGCVHAIGDGNLILEVQQNSDTTYRISDWGRLGADGKPRQLHVDQSKICLDFDNHENLLVSQRNGKTGCVPLVRCPFFQADEIILDHPVEMPAPAGKSFHLISSVKGGLTVVCGDTCLPLDPGASCLIPACCEAYTLIPSDHSIVMKTWI